MKKAKINPNNIAVMTGKMSSVSDIMIPEIYYKGLGSSRIPGLLYEDIMFGKVKINLDDPAQYPQLLKLCIIYSEYVEFEEINN